VFSTAPEGDLPAVAEAQVFVEADGPFVGEGDVEIGGDTGSRVYLGEVGDQRVRIPATGIGRIGADGAELVVAGAWGFTMCRMTHAFAGDGHEAALLTDTKIVAQEVGVLVVVAWLNPMDKVIHFVGVGGAEGFDGGGADRSGDGGRQDHLGAGQLEFGDPSGRQNGEPADVVEQLSGFDPCVEVAQGVGGYSVAVDLAGYEGEYSFFVAFGKVCALGEIFLGGGKG